jgi:transposase
MSRALFIEATNLLRAVVRETLPCGRLKYPNSFGYRLPCKGRAAEDFVKAELDSAINLPISRTETTPLAKTVRTCQQLLKIEEAMWTFVDHPDLEPTNNVAERALRPAVIWRMHTPFLRNAPRTAGRSPTRRGFLGVRCTKQRNTSFGSQSQGGSEFVARMLTVSSALKAQGRSVLDFLTQSCQASRLGTTPPTLIPMSEPTFCNERIILL